MKKHIMKFVAICMAAILTISYSLPSIAANITVPTEDLVSLFKAEFDAGEAILDLESYFNNEVQFNVQDFQASDYNAEWIADARTFISNTMASAPTVTNTSGTDDNSAKATSMAYAMECAAWSVNKGRGTNLSDEATYMFISHYIDRPEYYWNNSNNAFLLDGPSMSESSQYYAKWITNDDRTAYRTYMNSTKISAAFNSLKSTYSWAQTLIGNPKALKQITSDATELSNVMKAMKSTCLTYVNVANSSEAADSYALIREKMKHNPTKLSVLYDELITDDNIFRNFDETVRNRLISSSISTFASFIIGGVVGGLGDLKDGALNFVIDAYLDLIDLAAYAAMRYSFHGRMTNRMYDYMLDNY